MRKVQLTAGLFGPGGLLMAPPTGERYTVPSAEAFQHYQVLSGRAIPDTYPKAQELRDGGFSLFQPKGWHYAAMALRGRQYSAKACWLASALEASLLTACITYPMLIGTRLSVADLDAFSGSLQEIQAATMAVFITSGLVFPALMGPWHGKRARNHEVRTPQPPVPKTRNGPHGSGHGKAKAKAKAKAKRFLPRPVPWTGFISARFRKTMYLMARALQQAAAQLQVLLHLIDARPGDHIFDGCQEAMVKSQVFIALGSFDYGKTTQGNRAFSVEFLLDPTWVGVILPQLPELTPRVWLDHKVVLTFSALPEEY